MAARCLSLTLLATGSFTENLGSHFDLKLARSGVLLLEYALFLRELLLLVAFPGMGGLPLNCLWFSSSSLGLQSSPNILRPAILMFRASPPFSLSIPYSN